MAHSHLPQLSSDSTIDWVNREIENSYLSAAMQLSTAESALVWMSLKRVPPIIQCSMRTYVLIHIYLYLGINTYVLILIYLCTHQDLEEEKDESNLEDAHAVKSHSARECWQVKASERSAQLLKRSASFGQCYKTFFVALNDGKSLDFDYLRKLLSHPSVQFH